MNSNGILNKILGGFNTSLAGIASIFCNGVGVPAALLHSATWHRQAGRACYILVCTM